jgi:peptidoglycan hydrolase CwlO-like protein
MQEVIKKIEELYSLLEQKVSDNDKASTKLSAEKRKAIELVERHTATSKHLAAKERVLASREAVIKENDDLKKQIKKLKDAHANLDGDQKDLKSGQDNLDHEKAELQKLTDLYKKKNANCDAKIKELAAEKKILRETILKELTGKL